MGVTVTVMPIRVLLAFPFLFLTISSEITFFEKFSCIFWTSVLLGKSMDL